MTAETTTNKVQCLSCNAILESVHRHDFQRCECENQTFVDGGGSYLRIGGMDLSLVKVIRSSIDEEDSDKTSHEYSDTAKDISNRITSGRESESYFSNSSESYFLLHQMFRSTIIDAVENKFSSYYRIANDIFEYEDVDKQYQGLKYISDCLEVVSDSQVKKSLIFIRDSYLWIYNDRARRESPKSLSGYNNFIRRMCSKYSIFEDALYDTKLDNSDRIELNDILRDIEEIELRYNREDESVMCDIVKNRRFFYIDNLKKIEELLCNKR